MFAKIVKKDAIEENSDYRGRVVLPTMDNAEYKMDRFTNQIKYSTEFLFPVNPIKVLFSSFLKCETESISNILA